MASPNPKIKQGVLSDSVITVALSTADYGGIIKVTSIILDNPGLVEVNYAWAVTPDNGAIAPKNYRGRGIILPEDDIPLICCGKELKLQNPMEIRIYVDAPGVNYNIDSE